jgi:hypothetical protein
VGALAAALAKAWTGDVAREFTGVKLDAEEGWCRAAVFGQCGLSGAGKFYAHMDAVSRQHRPEQPIGFLYHMGTRESILIPIRRSGFH